MPVACRILLLAVLVLRCAAQRAPSPSGDTSQMEANLEKQPDNVEIRGQLIRALFRTSRQDPHAEQLRVRHIVWLVTHHPEAPVLGEPSSTVGRAGDDYNAVKNAWTAEIEKPGVTPQVLANAANFFRPLEPERSIELLARARSMDPKNWMWTAMLGQMYAFELTGISGLNQNGLPIAVDTAKANSTEMSETKKKLLASRDTELLGMVATALAGQGAIAAAMTGRMSENEALAEQFIRRAEELEPRSARWPLMRAQSDAQKAERSKGEERATLMRKAMAEYDAAAALDPNAATTTPPSRYARTAIEAGQLAKARASAELCLAQAPSMQTKDQAIHECNLTLGRVALRQGDVKRAGEYLLTAAGVHGTGALSSFGPNMLLAQELLQKGQRDVVLQYFELCREFWKFDRGQLTRWSEQVKAGQIPAFGANLVY